MISRIPSALFMVFILLRAPLHYAALYRATSATLCSLILFHATLRFSTLLCALLRYPHYYKDVRNTLEYFGLISYIYDGTIGYVMSRDVFPLLLVKSHVLSHVMSHVLSYIMSQEKSHVMSQDKSHVKSHSCKSHS